MFYRHRRVAADAPGPVVARLFARTRLYVRVVARDARKPIAAAALAQAQRQRFDVAHRPQPIGGRIFADEDRQRVGQGLTRRVEVVGPARRGNPRLSLEMTLVADAVAPVSRQLRGIDHRPEPFDMVASRSVTSLTSNPRLQERVAGEFVYGAQHRALDAAGMTEEARRIDRMIQFHLDELP